MNEIVGYIIVARSKTSKTTAAEPLSYGVGKDPYPHELLMRGSGTIFKTEEDAFDALARTLRGAEEDGAVWPAKNYFSLVPVRYAQIEDGDENV